MVRFAASMICYMAISQFAFGDQPVASGGRVHSHSAPVQPKYCYSGCQKGNQSCSNDSFSSIFEHEAEKLAELKVRATQLSQRFPYESPMEDSYFFRPYSVTEVSRQKRAGRDPKNPYDNRFLQSIYKQLGTDAGN